MTVRLETFGAATLLGQGIGLELAQPCDLALPAQRGVTENACDGFVDTGFRHDDILVQTSFILARQTFCGNKAEPWTR